MCVHLSLSGSRLFPFHSCAVASGSLWEAGALCGSPGGDLEEGEASSGPPWNVSLGARHPGLYQAAPPRPCQENPFPENHLQGVTETWPRGEGGAGHPRPSQPPHSLQLESEGISAWLNSPSGRNRLVTWKRKEFYKMNTLSRRYSLARRSSALPCFLPPFLLLLSLSPFSLLLLEREGQTCLALISQYIWLSVSTR